MARFSYYRTASFAYWQGALRQGCSRGWSTRTTTHPQLSTAAGVLFTPSVTCGDISPKGATLAVTESYEIQQKE